MSAKITKLSNGVEGVFIKNDRFNTTLISFNFYMPLKRETAAEYALLPFVLTTCSEKYPDFSRLNYKLSKYPLLMTVLHLIMNRFATVQQNF